MALIKSVLFIYGITGILVYFFKRRFEQLVPYSFILASIILMCFGFLRRLSFGYYFCWLMIAVFYVYLFVKKKLSSEYWKRMLTAGSVIFVLILVYIFFLQRSRGFNFWDEFGHWGPMVKESFRLNRFYSVEASTLQRHKDYPPFYTMIELLWCYFDSSYSEPALYTAILSFTASLFMPLLVGFELNLKGLAKGLLVSVAVFGVFLTVGTTPEASDVAHVFNSVYIDWHMAAFLAFSFYEIICGGETVLISLCFVSLLLMKQMGLPFYLLSLFLFVIRGIVKDKGLKSDFIKKVLVCVAVPLAFSFLWSYYIKSVGLSDYAQFKISDISLADFVAIVKGSAVESWHTVSFSNYLKAIVSRKLVVHPFGVSYFVYVVFVSLALLVINRDLKDRISLSITYALGSLGYCLAMLLLYCSCFGPSEGPQLASFDRYLITYLFFGNCLLMMLALGSGFSVKKCLIFLAVLGLFIEPQDIGDLLVKYERESLFGANAIAGFLDYPVDKGDRVLVIEQNITNVREYAMLGYINGDNVDVIKVGIPEWNGDDTLHIDLAEWENLISEYDYVYFQSLNDYFNEYYNSGEMKFSERVLYRNNNGVFEVVAQR